MMNMVHLLRLYRLAAHRGIITQAQIAPLVALHAEREAFIESANIVASTVTDDRKCDLCDEPARGAISIGDDYHCEFCLNHVDDALYKMLHDMGFEYGTDPAITDEAFKLASDEFVATFGASWGSAFMKPKPEDDETNDQ